jgi:hypothetical protein
MNWIVGLSVAAFLMAAPQEKSSEPVPREALYRFRGIEYFDRLSSPIDARTETEKPADLLPEEKALYRDGYLGVDLRLKENLEGADKGLVAQLRLLRSDTVTDQDLDDAARALWARYRAEVAPVLRERLGAMKAHRDALEKSSSEESKRLQVFVAGRLGDPKAQAASSAERCEVLRFRLADTRIDRSVKEAQIAGLRDRYSRQRAEAIEAGLSRPFERVREYEKKYTKDHVNMIEARESLARERERLERMGPADETTRQIYVRILDLEVELIGLEARQRAVEEDLAGEQKRLDRFRELEDWTKVEERLAALRAEAAGLDARIAGSETILEILEKGAPDRIR